MINKITIFTFILALAGCGDTQEINELEKLGKTYNIIGNRDVGYDKRSRVIFYIKSEAKDFSEKCGTLIKAAKEIYKEKKLDLTSIILTNDIYNSEGSNYPYLIFGELDYSPDGKNTGNANGLIWKISALKTDLSKKDLDILIEWETTKRNFLKNDGLVNEELLRNSISKKYNIPLNFQKPFFELADCIPKK